MSIFFRIALGVMIAPRRLDRALERLGAGIGKEDLVGKCRSGQPLGKFFLAST